MVTTRQTIEVVANFDPAAPWESNGEKALPFVSRLIPGKGRGLVATQRIRRGQRIMLQPPSVIASFAAMDELSRADLEDLLEEAVSYLPPSVQQRFYRQMGRSGAGNALDIIETNGFDIKIPGIRDEDGHHTGNWIDVSLFNHDCRPK
jgi:hypothetical protein